MAATHEYSCMIWLHVSIDYRNILTVNFTRGQKVIPAGWLLSVDRPEISLQFLATTQKKNVWNKTFCQMVSQKWY